MEPIFAYDIAYGKDHTDLAKTVCEMITNGWQPFGNMLIHDDGAQLGHCYQPMVKYDEE